jgi:hypothetical protein
VSLENSRNPKDIILATKAHGALVAAESVQDARTCAYIVMSNNFLDNESLFNAAQIEHPRDSTHVEI